jgi:Ca2+-binding EF-hand superfamily protein
MSSDDAIQEAFSLFDRDGVSSVSYADVGKAVRSLGYNPTEGELKEFLHQVDGANRYVSLCSAFAKVASLAVDIPRSVTQTFGTLSGRVCI